MRTRRPKFSVLRRRSWVWGVISGIIIGVLSTVAAQPISSLLYPPNHVYVPSLVGESVGDAERTAITEGFVLQETYLYNEQYGANRVVNQSISEGSIPFGGLVVVAISLGPPPSPLPAITITSPGGGSKVSWETLVQGNSTWVSSDNRLSIYILVFGSNAGIWWVEGQATLQLNGSWSGIAYFGSDPSVSTADIGKRFALAGIVTPDTLYPGATYTELPYSIAAIEIQNLTRT
jgi:hypothetical protein